MTHPPGNASARALSSALSGLFAAPTQAAAALAGSLLNRSSGCCDVPPPCWEPRLAGTCALELAPASSAAVRVHVANCGWSRQVVAITALGKLAAWMSFSPTTLMLDPQERATILVTLHVPDKAPVGQRLSAPIIIRGCRNHFVRLELLVADCSVQNCCDVMVNDCADHIHHWYDHFYCPRPCQNVRAPTGRGTQDG